ncbi:MCE family protein [Nocardioides sp. Bht2]|uniref:MCE family protein n=1 Tax=Nocardioides sp. Bht2 TaxID=3392297 RepID=UPI0039B67884
MTTSSLRRAVAVAVAGLLVVGGLLWWRSGAQEPIVVTADFVDTTGLYVGNDVQYLGVPVGSVTAIEPHGRSMRVRLELDPGTQLPRDAGANILQSSLVTDRYVELGPAYTGGPTLPDGAHLDTDRTRSPANVDQIASSIDDLVLALDNTTPGGRDIGDLLKVTARTFQGNGEPLRQALIDGEKALRTVNGRGDDLKAVTANLADLLAAVAARDTVIRRFATSLDATTAVVAEQRSSIAGTISSLDQLSTVVTRFVAKNRSVIDTDLAEAVRLARQVDRHRGSLAEAFDTMPTLAENLARAYDWRTGRLRVQFSTNTGPFSADFRSTMCRTIAADVCDLLFTSDGTGALDWLLDGLGAAIPGNLP